MPGERGEGVSSEQSSSGRRPHHAHATIITPPTLHSRHAAFLPSHFHQSLHVSDDHRVPLAGAGRRRCAEALTRREARPDGVPHRRHGAAPRGVLQGGLVRGGGTPGVRPPRSRRPEGAARHPPGPNLHLGRAAEPARRRPRRRAHRRGAPQVPPRQGLPRPRRARHAAPVRGLACRVPRRRRAGGGPRVQGPGGHRGLHARLGPRGAPRLLQRLRRVQGPGHVRPRLRRRRPPGPVPPVARPDHGARRARAPAPPRRRQRHHPGDRPQGHAQARAPRRVQPDTLPLPGQLPRDGRPQGVRERAVVLLRAVLHDIAIPDGAHQEQVRHRARGQRRRDALQIHPAGAGAGAVRRAEPRERAGERAAQAGVGVHHQGRREGVPGDRRHRGGRNDNVGPGRRRLGAGVRRRVRAGGGGRLHAVRGEDQEGPGDRRRARAQHLHGQGARQDGALHRQLRLTEAEGRRLPLLRAQAVGLGSTTAVAGGRLAGRLVLCSAFAWWRCWSLERRD